MALRQAQGVATRLALPLIAALFLAGCASRDVQKDLKIVDVHSGWYDAGIQADGKNKLVPSISIRLQNISQQPISGVQLNAIFHRAGETQVWGEHFVRAIGSDELAAGATTNPIVLRSNLGYTGVQSRLQMLKNKEFVDGTVEIFGKHGSRTWAKMGAYNIDRQLLTE
jgi:hypothetical protein